MNIKNIIKKLENKISTIKSRNLQIEIEDLIKKLKKEARRLEEIEWMYDINIK